MKKQILLIALTIISSASFMMSAQNTKRNSKEVKGIHPWNVTENNRNTISQEEAGWSLFLHGGFNIFNGDINVDMGKEAKHSVSVPSVGLGVEYKFNPTWGLGLDYTFRRVGVAGNTSIKDGAGNPVNMANLLRGFQHDASMYLTFDIFNLFFPNASRKLFALNLIAGGSFLAYRNTNQTPVALQVKSADGVSMTKVDHFKNKTGMAEYQNYYPDGSASREMDKYEYVGGFMGGALFEFNLSRSIGLGLRAIYHFYGNDKLDGRNNVGSNNDGVFDTELLLRWKLEAQKKSHSNNYANKNALARGGKKGKGDGSKDTIVVYHRDTVEIFHKDTVVMGMNRRDTTNIYNSTISYVTNPEPLKSNYYYVYFDPDRYNLSDDALVIIQQVADRMEEETNLYAAILGYCDNVGSAAYNKRLGQNRSQEVLEELSSEHGIAEDRMFAISKGIVVGKRSSSQYAPNRRVEIRLVDRAFFNQLRAQYRDDIELQKAFVKQR